MEQTLNRQQIGNGIYFSSIIDPKFKHNRLSIHAMLPLASETVSNNAMVPLMLQLGSRNLPDFSRLNARLNSLYGASLSEESSKYNRYQVLTLGIRSLDNRYALHGENLSSESAELLLDLFLNPNFDGSGAFFQKEFQLEQNYLIDTIEAEMNSKRSYAIMRMTQEMFRGSFLAIPQYGTTTSAQDTTPKATADAWHTMLADAAIELVFTGAGDPASVLEACKAPLALLERSPIEVAPQGCGGTAQNVNEVTEEMDGVQQGKLVLGFRCQPLTDRRQENAARLFSALYGGTPFSKLFLNVREKLSLCYYCSSRFDVVNNFLTVDSGVENDNRQAAQQEILHQLAEIQAGNITDEELADTKKLMATSLNSITDSLGALESWYFGQILRGRDLSPAQDLAELNEITKDDIVELANKVTLDTAYFLTGKEGA